MQRFLFLLGLLTCLAAIMAFSQQEQSGFFITKLGHDTVAVEEYSMSAGELHGTSIVRAPRTTVRKYSATFNDAGGLTRFEITYQRFDSAVFATRTFEYTADSVRVTNKQDNTPTATYTLAAAGTPFPLYIDIFGPWQAAIQRALQPANKNKFSILAGRRLLNYEIKGTTPGAIDLLNPGGDFGPLHAVIGNGGSLEKMDLTETTDKFVSVRVPSLDVQALAKDFAARERTGKPSGLLSPRDTVRTAMNGASLMIDYGRPSMRGRTIFGNIVPWNTVWRTGANAATQLITNKDLTIGDTLVPAGTYSLFTLPKEGGWTLIINKQHGQWGTSYDSTKDLARIPIKTKHLDQPVEKFTIDIEAEGNAGEIVFQWENTEGSVEFKVK